MIDATTAQRGWRAIEGAFCTPAVAQKPLSWRAKSVFAPLLAVMQKAREMRGRGKLPPTQKMQPKTLTHEMTGKS